MTKNVINFNTDQIKYILQMKGLYDSMTLFLVKSIVGRLNTGAYVYLSKGFSLFYSGSFSSSNHMSFCHRFVWVRMKKLMAF